jgi:hypothetical protein
MKRYLAALLFAVVTCTANATGEVETLTSDSFLEVVQNLAKKYYELKSYSVDLTYRSYTTYETTALEEESTGFIHRSGFDYTSYAGNVLMLRNERAMLTVDSVEKTVIISDPKPDMAPEMMEFQSKWVKNSAKSITTSIKNGLRTYTVKFLDGISLKSYEFTLNTAGLLYRISIYYNINREEGFGTDAHMVNYTPRLEITFGEYHMNPVFSKNEFSEKSILRTSDNKLYFLPKGSTFQIYDQRIVKPD